MQDLEKILQLPGLRILPDVTKRKYQATWKSLRSRYPAIQMGSPPTQADKNSYLRTKIQTWNQAINY